jgi:glycosyltransferase involved in cell wall biosynthesis
MRDKIKNTNQQNRLISIVIPTKDRVESLKKVLPSYLNQEYLKEIIIINDGSTDNTDTYIVGLLRTNPLLKYIKNPVNKGVPTSRNIGIAKAKGKYIFFGEDDVELAQNHISTLLKHLKFNNADIIAGRHICPKIGEKKLDALKTANLNTRRAIDQRKLLADYSVNLKCDKQLPLAHSLMLIKKHVFKTIKYDELYKVNFWREESDFQLTAAEQGFKLYYCGHTVSFNVFNDNNKGGCHSSNIFLYKYWCIKNNLYFINKHAKYLKENLGLKSKTIYIINFTLFLLVYGFIIPSICSQINKIVNKKIFSFKWLRITFLNIF